MKIDELHAIHRDPANWYLWFFYFAPADPRLVVRKRIHGLGWTVNFARPLAVPLIVGLAVVGWLTFERLSYVEMSENMKWLCVLLFLAMIAALGSWLSNPRRHAK
jgi:hypothetical protein